MSCETDSIRYEASVIQPRHPSFIKCCDRLDSFVNWPEKRRQTPNQLAANGLFYTGIEDRVTCFMCGVTLKYWNYFDDIKSEHVRWSKACIFQHMLYVL